VIHVAFWLHVGRDGQCEQGFQGHFVKSVAERLVFPVLSLRISGPLAELFAEDWIYRCEPR